MKIIGEIGDGGLGYVTTALMSILHNINAPLRFYIDTGCAITTISQLDTLRIGLNYDRLKMSDHHIVGITGLVK